MEAATELLLCERLHARHDPRWLLLLPPPLCLACVIETLGDGGASLVRRKHVLACFRDVLAWHAVPVVQLLAQDERVCVHLIGTLFGMLHTAEDSNAVDLPIEVLVQLVVELKLEQYVHCVLDESQKELSKAATMRGSLPTFNLLGKLADAIPVLADILVIEHGNLMDHLLAGLLYPNEGVKAAVCYLYGKLYSSPISSERLSVHFTEGLCDLFLATLGNAQTKELQVNCIGLLKELLKSDHFASVIMSNSRRGADSENTELLEGENPLPLVLKKLLLSRDEMIQVASAQCMAAVLVHSPVKYAPAFIHADIPEFLFERLSCTSEILLWQPVEIKLFTNVAICKDAIGVLVEAVKCPVLEVAAEAVKAVVAILRKDHLSCPPVQYAELQKLIETMLKRCTDLSLPPINRRPAVCRKHSERTASPALMEFFMSALSTLFVVVPSMREKFSRKLASSSFIRLALELKAKFCTGQSNPALNQACSSFLYSLCVSLHSAAEKIEDSSQEEREMSELLQRSLPQLNCSVAESLTLLSETPDPFCLDEALRSHQYCLLLLLYFAYTLEDRFVPETELFSAIRNFLLSVQDQGDCPPPYVFKAVLYLLAVCQDKGEAIDLSPLCAIRRVLEKTSDLGLIYIHHPLLLKFFLRYSELMGRFGHQILQLWFSCEDYSQIETEDAASGLSSGLPDYPSSFNTLLHILKGNSSVLLILLDLLCMSTMDVAHKVLMTLRTFLKINEDVLVCDLLRSQFLQILQQLLVESTSTTLQANKNLPLLLSLLFLVQLRNEAERELDSTDLKLLHHVSNLCGKCRPGDVELLQPSLNFLYWSLHQTTTCSQQRVVAVLLSSVPLLELLQKVLELTWMWPCLSGHSFSSSEEALLCSAWLLTSSLLAHQHRYNSEVHRMISLDLEKVLNAVIFRRQKPALLLVSILQFLRAILRQNFSSSLLALTVQPPAQSRMEPSLSEDHASLHPLAMWHVLSLVVSLQNLLVQKDLLLSQTVVACLEVLMVYLHRKNQGIALHVISQPWNRFLLFTLLDGGKNSFLCPEILRLMTLFVRYQSSNIISQSEISQILQEAAKAKLAELPDATSHTLRLFLLQLQSRNCQMDPAQEGTIQTLLESLPARTKTHLSHQDMVCLGGVAVSLSHIAD